MPTGLYLAQVIIPHTSGVPEDADENVFTFFAEATASEAADVAAITSRLTAFYNTPGTGAVLSVGERLSAVVSRVTNQCKIRIYFKADETFPDPFGSPIATNSFTMDAVSGGSENLPSEVAIALSFHGDLTDVPETAPNPTPPPNIIRPAARKRGRVFLGPLRNTCAVAQAGTGETIVSDGALLTVSAAGHDLAAASNALGWVVWSRADEASHVVVGGFVDNAFDTERKRGQRTSARTLWTN